MIKMICDKCKREVEKLTRIEYGEDVYGGGRNKGVKIANFRLGAYDLCDECLKKLQQLKIEIKDFMKMSDEEIELALYTFKVGDEVITADGRVGTITSICTCDKCKERGFYEPRVETEVGIYDIWITDTDKNNGFISYYKIGDRVFGNIDENEEKRLIEDIDKRQCEINSLEEQLEVLKKIKEEKNV